MTPFTERGPGTWGPWARWCAARALSPQPGDPAVLCAYLTERAAAGLAVTSLDGACTAIRHVHRMHGLDDPFASSDRSPETPSPGCSAPASTTPA